MWLVLELLKPEQSVRLNFPSFPWLFLPFWGAGSLYQLLESNPCVLGLSRFCYLSVWKIPSTLCPIWGECWSKWGLCAHWGLMGCLWTCLWLRSDIAPNSMSFPFPCYDHPRSSAGLWHRVAESKCLLKWECGCWSCRTVLLTAEVWAASVVLFVLSPVVATPAPPRPHPTHLDHLSFARFSLFQDVTVLDPTPCCSWNEWGWGVCPAWVGEWSWSTASNAKLSVLSVGKPAPMHFLSGASAFPAPALLFVPGVLPVGWKACLLCVGPQNRDIQAMAWSAYSVG